MAEYCVSSISPTNAEFTEILSTVSDWYTLGIFLGAESKDLKNIDLHRSVGVKRCLIELYEYLETRGRIPTWKFLSSCLKRMNNAVLHVAKRIDAKFIVSPIRPQNSREGTTDSTAGDDTITTTTTTTIITTTDPVTSDGDHVKLPPEITSEFQSLFDRFTTLNLKIKKAFAKSRVNLSDVEHVIHRQCGLEPLVGEKTTFDDVFRRLEQTCSIFDSHVLTFLIRSFLSRNQILLRELKEYEKAVDTFKSSAKMGHLVRLIKRRRSVRNGGSRNLKLKVKELWKQFSMKQFEKAMTELLGKLCDHVSQMSVDEGSLCIEWIIPDIDTTNMIPCHSSEFTSIIGVLSLHIGDDVLYDHTTEKGGEVLDAAMLEAIQLKNTEAIEFFLAMGCNPEVATYNGDNAVTTIVNIRESNISMADLVTRDIAKEGKLNLRIVKVIVLGGPGVGKTTTLKRLFGKMTNLTTDPGPSLSTGIDPAKMVHLRHILNYEDAAEISDILLAEDTDWTPLTIQEQAKVLVHCLKTSPTSSDPPKDENASSDLSQMSDLVETSQPPSQTTTDSGSVEDSSSPSHFDMEQFNRAVGKLFAEANYEEIRKKLQPMLDTTTMLHIIDTGGQPEIFEILPLILRGSSLCLIFLSLVQELDKYHEVKFQSKHDARIKYISSYKPLEMIQQVLASLESATEKSTQPEENKYKRRAAAGIIATHLDMVDDNDASSEEKPSVATHLEKVKTKSESVKHIENEIKTTLKSTSFYRDDLLRYFYYGSAQQPHLIFPLDNQNGDKEEINSLRKELTQMIDKTFDSEPLPTSWGIFHLVLRSNAKNGFCSLNEAITRAKYCGIHDEEKVPRILEFFHDRFGTIFYFGDVESLKDLVFCDLNLVFHPITKLVAESFGANASKPNAAERIRATGEIEWEFFKYIYMRAGYKYMQKR